MEIDHQVSETARPRRRIAWLKGIGWGMLILAFFVAVGLFWNRERKASKLEEMLAEMDRSEPGWRLDDIEAAREEVPEEENSARVIVAAARLLPQPWPPKELAEEHFRLLPPNEMLSGEDFVLLSRELARVRPALTMVTPLAEMPRGRYPLPYDGNHLVKSLPHLQESLDSVILLVYESMRQNQRGESKKALRTCRAALNAARSVGDEPPQISQTVRHAGVIRACQAIERTLGQGEAPPEDLGDFQNLLENEDHFRYLLVGVRGQRAVWHQLFEAVEQGQVSPEQVPQLLLGDIWSAPSSSWLQRTVASLERMDTRQDHALFLSLTTRLLHQVQLPLHEQAAMEKLFDRDVGKLPKNAVLTRFLMRGFRGCGEAHRRRSASLRCTIAALAAERYRRDKTAWPNNIDNLCPEYLAGVPLDPFDGLPLRYRRLEDGVMIYSVGQDVVDNGGHLDRVHSDRPGVDIGVRLWDVDKRRQPRRPKPNHEQQPR